jgi:hypothetical protein
MEAVQKVIPISAGTIRKLSDDSRLIRVATSWATTDHKDKL